MHIDSSSPCTSKEGLDAHLKRLSTCIDGGFRCTSKEALDAQQGFRPREYGEYSKFHEQIIYPHTIYNGIADFYFYIYKQINIKNKKN
jgi:hypothetical protein